MFTNREGTETLSRYPWIGDKSPLNPPHLDHARSSLFLSPDFVAAMRREQEREIVLAVVSSKIINHITCIFP